MEQVAEKNALKIADTPAKAPLAASNTKVMAIIPHNLDEVWRLAKAISLAGWAPKSYKLNDGSFDQEKIAVAIMHGMEVGFTPIAALQSIAVINGMPSIYGDGALALVRSSGLLEDFKETSILDGAKVVGYHCYAKRRGMATPTEYKFLRADAERAHLIGKSGPWTEYEPRMYQMRARAWVLRDGFADVLRGLAIAEEALDVPERDITNTASHVFVEQPKAIEQPKAKTESAAPANAPTSSSHEGSPPAGGNGAAPDRTNGEPIKPSQVAIVRAKLKNAGLTDIDLEAGFPGKCLEPKEGKEQFASSQFTEVTAWIEKNAKV